MKPFLTEAGSLAFDHWYKAILQSLKTAFPSIVVAPRVQIQQEDLVREILNVMIAVPSVDFMLDLVCEPELPCLNFTCWKIFNCHTNDVYVQLCPS